MKLPAVITCIACGTVLMIAPLAYRAVAITAVANILAHGTNSSFSTQGGALYWYDETCLVSGIVLILIGVAAAFRTEGRPTASRPRGDDSTR